MDLSIVLPVYNAPADAALCLDSLRRHFGGDRCELIIINDASAPETTELLRAFVRDFDENQAIEPVKTGKMGESVESASTAGAADAKGSPVKAAGKESRLNPPLIRLVEHAENKGYLRSANEGLTLASGEVIVILNSDTAIPAGFGERVLACFASDERIGLASPVASHCGLFSIPMKPNLEGKDVDVMDAFLRPLKPEYPTVILPDGFCFCVRKKLVDQIGFFDERYDPGYFEETDYGMRARRASWKTVLIDNLYVYHKAQASFGASRNQELVQRNEALFNELWGKEFATLRAQYPREKQKPRLYAFIYSGPERLWRRVVRCLAQLCPHAPTRRAMRRKYN